MASVTNELGEEILPAYRGNLTASQQKDLREMWRRLFELMEKNVQVSERVMANGGPSKVPKNAAAAPKNEKDAGKDIPKDDKAKEEAKKAEEMKEMNEFIDKYGGPILRSTMWEFTKMDHPDTSLLRFLRARKWDIDRALAMMAAACKFRIEKDVIGIIEKGEDGLKDVPGFMNQFRRGISYIKGNTDKMENPIYFIHVSRHFTSAQKHEVLQDYVLLAMENARLITTAPYEKAVVVFDMAGFGLKNMDWQCVLFLVKCLEAYYPESLQRIYVHGAPWIFKGIWQVLQPMLDPVVRDKIKFSSKAHDLAELVPASKIRKGMGGTMDWDWDYIEPQAGENDIMKDTKSRKKIEAEMKELTDEFEKVTREWFETTANDDENEDLAYRREVLAKQVRLKNYQLQPFVRAKNIYQRSGLMTMDGTVTWEYPQVNGKSITQVVNNRHNYGALIKWLKEHNEDTLEDSFGHQKLAEICTDGTIKKSYGGGKGGKATNAASTKSGDKKSKKGEAAAAGVAAGAAAGAKRAKSKKKREPEPEPEPEESEDEGFEDPESEPEPEPAPVKRSASNNKSLARKPTKKAVDPEPEPEPEDDEQKPQSYTGAAVGAVAGVAAGVGGAAAAGLSYLRGGNRNNGAAVDSNDRSARDEELEEEDEEDDVEDHGVARPGQRQQPRTVDHYPDEDDEFDEGESPDDDQMSAYSDESITPETAVRPDYMQHKISASDCRIDDNDCREDLATVREAMALFLNSRMREAEDLCIQGAGTRLYKAEGMALINSVKSIMTFEPADFETAILCCQHSMKIAGFLRKKQGAIGKLIGGGKMGNYRSMSLVQLHAELVFAESQLLKSVLGIFYSGDSIGFVRQALGLRAAYFQVRELFKFVEAVDAEAEEAEVSGKRSNAVHLDQDFRSGVYLGNAVCSLVLSMLPTKTLKIMEGFGFVGDRKFSLDLFARAGGWSKSKPLPTISADEEGVRRPLCDIVILMYHLWISSYIPVTELDFEFADKVLSWNLVRFPNGIFYLFWSARLYAAQALPEKAIEYYRNAIESQREFKQLHHLCFWDLSLTYLCTCDFARAYECYDVLSRESNWSKAIYQYAKAVMLYETGMDDRAKSATIMRTVGKLTKKVAGRQIPFERFVALKAKKYIAQQNRLALPGLEFSYLWHCIGQTPVFLLVENTLTRIDEFIDELESYHNPKSYGTGENEYWSAYCLAFFLRGVALRFVAYPEPQTLVRLPAEDTVGPIEEIQADAVQSFNKVFEHGSKLDAVDRYLVYFAHYELGRLRGCMGQDEAAKTEFRKVLSGKPLEAKGKGLIGGGSKANYLLSNMCQVRAHAAMETMRIQKSRSRSSFFHGAEGSLASQSIASKSTRSNSLASSTSRSMTSRGTSMSSRSGRGSVKSNTHDAEEGYRGNGNGRPRADTGRSHVTDYSRRR
ncbi:related to CSR1 - phosphatidylinositol transfer protein [Melanopsichium pennsylvanicum]|uniref:Related to CSR1 - phosphatidylinositol transfer protein n=2 Tax=Melanopsichium pennsylvanicum TaxID=63383 RepID=A0AAJ4XTP4_9BASI|nr:related to CSR1-phosphatidylinositol transfer protein [Melanopsichium pennsylvanicum 4]SNX87831.1 related to CSR1 - phosphatidylinositol transfer protein [Melanopsichium pennsylvanicum]